MQPLEYGEYSGPNSVFSRNYGVPDVRNQIPVQHVKKDKTYKICKRLCDAFCLAFLLITSILSLTISIENRKRIIKYMDIMSTASPSPSASPSLSPL
jgi:hypothetical protein